VLSDGKLMLDDQRVWVDAWQLQRLAAPHHGAAGMNAGSHLAKARQILSLYHGPFLHDEDSGWAYGQRERLTSLFLNAVTPHIEAIESDGHFDEAIALNSRVIDVAPIADRAYCGLIRSLMATGRELEALASYERCRQSYLHLLGKEPGAEIRGFLLRQA